MARFLFPLFFVLVLIGCAVFVRTPAYEFPQKTAAPQGPSYYRGIYHVHSKFSGDSFASLDQIWKTARKAGLDFVVITDHNTIEGKEAWTVRHSERSEEEGPQLIFGEEVTTLDGHFVALGLDQKVPVWGKNTQQILDWVHQNGGYAFLSHPFSKKNGWRDWKLRHYDGIEIYNFAHTFYESNKAKLVFDLVFLPPGAFLKSHFQAPAGALRVWDEQLGQRRLPVVGAVDAHLKLRWLGIAPSNLLLQFQSVTLYVEAEALSESSIIQAIARGKTYTAFEFLGPAAGFRFWREGSQLKVSLPQPAEVRLIHDEKVIQAHFPFQIPESGTYRAEVYREGKLWILSNAIEMA